MADKIYVTRSNDITELNEQNYSSLNVPLYGNYYKIFIVDGNKEVIQQSFIEDDARAGSSYYILPAHYGNGYSFQTTPYVFQNIESSVVTHNKDVIKSEISKALQGEDNDDDFLKWLRVINTVDYENEFEKTFEKDYARKFGDIINDNLKFGKRDLLQNYEVDAADIQSAGYNVTENSILYPQFGLFWNTFYNKYFGVWYTPVKKDGSIINRNTLLNYIRNLCDEPSYFVTDTEEVILKVTSELGLSIIDINSIATGNLTPKVQETIADLNNWCLLLNEMQYQYQFLVSCAEDEDLIHNYIFIDEDKNIFSTIRKSYFLFKITQNYYGDLDPNINFQDIDYWSPDKDYEAGDIVLGTNSSSDSSNYNYLYRCLHTHTHTGTFDRTVMDKQRIYNSDVDQDELMEVPITQWEYLNSEYAKEIDALTSALAAHGKTYNKNDWIRFALPIIEDERPIEYYTNGDPKPNQQNGYMMWPSGGFTLREITHVKKDEDWIAEWEEQHPGEEPADEDIPRVTYTNYKNIIETDLDETEPLDEYLVTSEKWASTLNEQTSSPSDNSITLVNTGKKIIHYFPKQDAFFAPLVLQSKLVSIKEEAFKDRQDLYKVVLRSALNKIDNRAFSNCANLYQVLLPRNLSALGVNAFSSCTSLRRATLPNGIDKLVGTYAGCTNLQSVCLSARTTSIGAGTFTNCSNLTKIYNTSKIKELGVGAFNGCTRLENFTIPSKVDKLPARLFKGCKNCVFTFEMDEVTELGESCFEGCEKLTSTFSFNKIKQLSPGTFKDCKSLTSITFDFMHIDDSERPVENGIKQNVYIVPAKFCYGCTNLQTIDLGIAEELDDSCFQRCTSLSQVTIPSSVNFVGKNVFYDCFQLGLLIVPTYYTPRQGEKVSKMNSWIENERIINEANRHNWVDRVFTRVVTINPSTGSEVDLYWIL